MHLLVRNDWQVRQHCEINGLVCLNEHYEDLSIVIAAWSKARRRKGIVCDCLPSCYEVDILMIHETRENIYDPTVDPYSIIELALANLPTERYKRNVVRGKLDLVGETRAPLAIVWLIRFESTLFFLLSSNSLDWRLNWTFCWCLSPVLCRNHLLLHHSRWPFQLRQCL